MTDQSEETSNPTTPKKMTSSREDKNAVFGPTTQDIASGVAVTQQTYVHREFGMEIPLDLVPLPSRGLVYPVGHPCHRAESVEYRGMTVREEDLLMSPALLKKGTVITEVMKACLTNKAIDPNSLIAGDRNAIMLAIRASSYGVIYDAEWMCPSCQVKNDIPVDLAELGIKILELTPTEPGANLFDFVLPMSQKRVTFKYLTGFEEENIIRTVEGRKKRGMENTTLITTKLQEAIVSVEGFDRGTTNRFIGMMLAGDSAALRSYMDTNEPGVNMTIWVACKSCEHGEDIQMPFGASFFWPKAK
jgi:hypothetical protein